jgi:peptidoglycan/LPS O-acetylase OafA/YrhL
MDHRQASASRAAHDCRPRSSLGERLTAPAVAPRVTVSPREGSARYQLLDVFRGLACLMVVVHHAGYAIGWRDVAAASQFEAGLRGVVVLLVERLSLGVPLFFVISGYCILASVEATRRKGASPWDFLGRRFWRIYPTYWVALLGFIVIVAGLDAFGLKRLHCGTHAVKLASPFALDFPRWVGNLTLTETWRPHVWGPARDVFTGVAWSLCYEEQFYFVCFLALVLAPRRMLAILATVTVGAIALRVGAWHAGCLSRIAGTFPLLWHQFAIGVVVYYRLNMARSWQARLAWDLGLVAMLIAGLAGPDRETATAAGFGILLVALRRWDERAEAIAWLKPLRACGLRCYSIYLVHLPVCVVGSLGLYELGLTSFWGRVLVMIPIDLAVSVAVSWAFFDLVESRVLAPPVFRRNPAGGLPTMSLVGKVVRLRA